MTEFDLGWLVALLEGEGCFSSKKCGYARVKLSMSDVDVVERAARLMGGKKVRRYRPSNPRDKRDRSDMYEVALNGFDAIRIMNRILPYMGIRRRTQICEALNAWVLKPRIRKNSPICPRGHDKTVSGVYGKGQCKACVKLRYLDSRAALSA